MGGIWWLISPLQVEKRERPQICHVMFCEAIYLEVTVQCGLCLFILKREGWLMENDSTCICDCPMKNGNVYLSADEKCLCSERYRGCSRLIHDDCDSGKLPWLSKSVMKKKGETKRRRNQATCMEEMKYVANRKRAYINWKADEIEVGIILSINEWRPENLGKMWCWNGMKERSVGDSMISKVAWNWCHRRWKREESSGGKKQCGKQYQIKMWAKREEMSWRLIEITAK